MFSPSTRPPSPSELRSNSQWPLDSYPAARTTRHNWWFPLQVRVLIRRAGDVMVKICQTTQGLKQEKQTQGLNQRQTSEFSATKQRALFTGLDRRNGRLKEATHGNFQLPVQSIGLTRWPGQRLKIHSTI